MTFQVSEKFSLCLVKKYACFSHTYKPVRENGGWMWEGSTMVNATSSDDYFSWLL